MALSLRQLLEPVSKDEATNTAIDILVSMGFPGASAWQSGGNRRGLLELTGQIWSDVSITIVAVARFVINEYAEGDWLTILSKSFFDNERQDPVATQGTIKLTAASTAPGPFVIAIGDLIFADGDGIRYTNITGGTLNAGGTLDLTIQADEPGAAGDVANDAIMTMVTPLTDVTCTNPDTGGTGTWISRNGADEEPDETLRERNRDKWPTLSATPPGLAYKTWAIEADSAITRAEVDDQNPRGPGTLDVYIAGVAGALSAGTVQTALDYINGDGPDGIQRRGNGADLQVFSAAENELVLTGTVYIASAYNNATKQAEINAAVQSFFKKLRIGGTRLADPFGTGYVLFAEYHKTVMSIEGVVNFAPTGDVTGDVALAANEVAKPNMATPFTFTSV